MRTRINCALLGIGMACVVLAGCASQSNDLTSTPGAYDKALADADALAKGGDKDHALAQYQTLAAADPTREEPWSRIAQIQFDQQHYGQAIVAAQEALQRDKTDRAAKSVLAVAGLRVATESLGELRQDASLQGDARSDAQVLAKELRDTLGQDALFPPEQQPVTKPDVAVAAPVRKRHVPPHVVHKAAVASKESAPAPAASSSADPFGALRQ
jgi:tetratricopeptide (TPR) repeat protein